MPRVGTTLCRREKNRIIFTVSLLKYVNWFHFAPILVGPPSLSLSPWLCHSERGKEERGRGRAKREGGKEGRKEKAIAFYAVALALSLLFL